MLSRKPIAEQADHELLQSYRQSGETALMGHLFARYKALVYGVCLKYLKDREEAKDAVMSIFEKLVSTLLEHEVTHFKSWLYVTTRNHCLMQLRSQKSKRTVEISPFLMETDTSWHQEDATDLEGNLVKLERCIEKLVMEQKRCVQLFYLQRKCYQEISQETSYNLKQVKSYIQNGKRNLKLCMEQHD
jgi:RNA polymerase sigma factor (sigma-70 family)